MKTGDNNNVFMFLTCPVIGNHHIKTPDAAKYVKKFQSVYFYF